MVVERSIGRRDFLKAGAVAAALAVTNPAGAADFPLPQYSSAAQQASTKWNQGDIYNFGGTLYNTVDSTRVANAELIFTGPEGVEFKTYTNPWGEYQTSIDTHVEYRPEDKLQGYALSAPLQNPTGGRTAFAVQVQSQARLGVYNIKGEELSDVVLGTMNGSGRFQVSVDLRGKAAGTYFARLETDQGWITQPFTHLPGKGFPEYTGGAVEPLSWKTLQKPTQSGWSLTVTHPDYYTSILPLEPAVGDNPFSWTLMPGTFRMDWFNEMARRTATTGYTKRYEVCPKLLIIDGPIEGHNHFLAPNPGEIEAVKAVWKDFYHLTNGFINIPDSSMYVSHNPNDPIFQQAIKKVGDGFVTLNDGWNVVVFSDLISTGDHGETISPTGEILSSVQYLRPSSLKRTKSIEAAQSLGLTKDPVVDTRWDVRTNYFSTEFQDCIRFNYSRPAGTLSEDISTKPWSH